MLEDVEVPDMACILSVLDVEYCTALICVLVGCRVG